MNTDAPRKLLSVLATVLALCSPFSVRVAAQDLVKQQLAASDAESLTPEQREAVLDRTREYEEERARTARLVRQIEQVSATTALLAGAAVGAIATGGLGSPWKKSANSGRSGRSEWL